MTTNEIWKGWCWKREDGQIEYWRIMTDATVWKSEDMAKTYFPYGHYIAGTVGVGDKEIKGDSI